MKKFQWLFIVALFVISPFVEAKNDFVYRNRINWVKLDELSKKQLAGVTLLHPYTGLSEVQMQAMLRSLQMNRGSAFKSEIKTTDIFDEDEAQKFAPLLVKALAQAQPNEVVNMSLVHKRAKSIVRNDHLSILNVYVTQEGVHFYFGKLFAKLDGDYMEVSKMDQTIRNAKSMRVSLTAGAGQTLSFGAENELVLDPKFDFLGASTSSVQSVATTQNVQPQSKSMAKTDNTNSAVAPTLDERLKTLDELKEKGLITTKEYKTKKKEILNDI